MGTKGDSVLVIVGWAVGSFFLALLLLFGLFGGLLLGVLLIPLILLLTPVALVVVALKGRPESVTAEREVIAAEIPPHKRAEELTPPARAPVAATGVDTDRERTGRRKRTGVRRSPVLRRVVAFGAPAVAVIAVAVGISMVFQSRDTSSAPAEGIALPTYVRTASSDVKEAYAFAIENFQTLQYIPCYCGCGQHSGHNSNHDCFVQPGHLSGGPVVFDPHGANCQMCVDIARDAKRLVQQGKSLREARQYVVARYGGTGPATNTPPIP